MKSILIFLFLLAVPDIQVRSALGIDLIDFQEGVEGADLRFSIHESKRRL